MTRISIFLPIAILCLAMGLNAQITPAEAVAQMDRGINLGNTLEPPHEGDWNNPNAEESYFDDYVEAGFNTVRIPVTWDKHVAGTSPYTIDKSWLDRVEEVVDWGLSRDLFVILNAHHEGWLKEDCGNQATRDRFDSIWSQVSVRFKGKTEKLFFEMLNEPRTHEHDGLTQIQIDELNERVLGIIRKDHPTRIVVYSGKGWSSASDMMAAAVPDDPYMIAYYHSYDPWNFAGDGNGTWGTDSDRNSLYSSFRNVRSWADENGLEILLGEFGAVEDCDYNSRMIHYASYVRGCLENNIAFTVWDDGGWFEVLKRSSHTWHDSKDILVHTTLNSPDNISLTAVYDTAMLVEWKNAPQASDSIVIERREKDGAFIPLGGVAPEMQAFTDTSVQSLNTYTYRVIAIHDTIKSYSYPVKKLLEPAFPNTKIPFLGENFEIPGTVEAEDYDYGGEGVSYNETTKANILEAYRPYEGVDIEEGSGGSFLVGEIKRGEWMEYSLNVSEEGPYRITTSLSSPKGGGVFRMLFSGKILATVNVPSSGDWNSTEEVVFHVHLDKGEQVMRILTLALPDFKLDNFTFSSAVSMEPKKLEKLIIYPNPVTDRLFFQLEDDTLFETVKIFSAEGVMVKQVEAVFSSQGLDVSELSPGLYFVQLEGEQFPLSYRFLKAL